MTLGDVREYFDRIPLSFAFAIIVVAVVARNLLADRTARRWRDKR